MRIFIRSRRFFFSNYFIGIYENIFIYLMDFKFVRNTKSIRTNYHGEDNINFLVKSLNIQLTRCVIEWSKKPRTCGLKCHRLKN